MMGAPPAPRRAPEAQADWTLAELGRSVTNLAGAVSTLTDTLGRLGATVAAHGERLRTVERFLYGATGAAVSLTAGALLSGHVHWR